MFISVDVGGTFTDFVALCDRGEFLQLKTFTSTEKPWENVIRGISTLMETCKRGNFSDEDTGLVFHATTLATNALLGQRGLETAKTALITTKGFRGVLAIGRQNRPKLYDPYFSKPRQLIPDELIFEVNERTSAKGEVEVPVDEAEIERISESLSHVGVESIAIAYINSYVNPHNENATERVLSKRHEFVISSHKVSPSIREYERTSTAVVNAVLLPRIYGYLKRLWDGVNLLGIRDLYVMSSSGGLVRWDEAAKTPSIIVESGPAAGVIGSSVFAAFMGESRVVSFDMGGTTAKASSIIDYSASLTPDYEVGGETHHGRLVKGTGYPIRHTFVDLAEVSAGGGTVIWRDAADALRVGPISVGASPGPMCYGLGGTEPTITDANVVLGRIPAHLSIGGLKLNPELSLKGLSRLGDPYEVAWEAIKMADLEMARAIRLVTVERGHDPGSFSLFAYGGGGPLHATGVAAEIGIRRVVIPPFPGLFSSLSMLLSDLVIEVSAYVDRELDEVYRRLEQELVERIRRLRVDNFKLKRYIEARYRGQGWELLIPLPEEATALSVKEVFDKTHEMIYGYSLDEDVEVTVARLVALIESPYKRLVLDRLLERYDRYRWECREEYARVYIDGIFENVPVYCRGSIEEVAGPSIIIDYGSTIYVDRGWRAMTGKMGTIVLERD